MKSPSPEERAKMQAHGKRATARARKKLKIGDCITYRMCAGLHGTSRITGWSGDWICTLTKSDIHALHIYLLNGEPISFAD